MDIAVVLVKVTTHKTINMTDKDLVLILRRRKQILNKKKRIYALRSDEREFLKDTMYVLHLAIKRIEKII